MYDDRSRQHYKGRGILRGTWRRREVSFVWGFSFSLYAVLLLPGGGHDVLEVYAGDT